MHRRQILVNLYAPEQQLTIQAAAGTTREQVVGVLARDKG